MSTTRSDHRPPEPRPVSTLAGALWDEFEAIHGETRPAILAQGPDAALCAYYDAALRHDQAALCISGGGIRSAAFSLGVLQALARQKLLTRFDYLSTVSGGGYIGSWLTTFLHAHGGDAEQVQRLLADDTPPDEVRTLRKYTNFLAPRPGVASPDTWSGILLWVRNTLINWLIFLPGFLALALVPSIYAGLLTEVSVGLGWPLLLIALLCLGVGIYNGAEHLPSHAFPDPESRGRRSRFVAVAVVAPLLVWSLLVPLVAAPWLRQVMPENAIPGDVIPVLAFVVMDLAFVAAGLHARGRHRSLFWHNFGWWTLGALIASALLWLALDLGIGQSVPVIVALGPLAVTLAHLMQSLVYVALRTESFRGDLDREWLARLNAEKVVPTLLWAAFAAVCLFLPPLVFGGKLPAVYQFLVSAFGLLTGPLAAYISKISKDGPAPDISGGGTLFSLPLNLVVSLIALVFAAVLLLLLSKLGSILTGDRLSANIVLLAIAALLAGGLGQHINVNRFSMHAVYRNRLVRAFLGSARRVRSPDGFTGMDPHDNPRMVDVFQRSGMPRALFHVVNITLNMTAGRNTAWNERKGESFTMTPTACGAAFLHRQEDKQAGLPVRGAYVRTIDYAGSERETGPDDCRDPPGTPGHGRRKGWLGEDPGRGVTLGTAMALSGAAASPNMGYHSSPAAAFLMTLFNVRLGAWLPNPAIASTRLLRRAKPPNALFTLVRELLGRSSDRSKDVYLSDGGHFENLGLYEMVRRRCRRIVVIDADADPDMWFEELGNSVRKIRIDLNVNIDFDPRVAIGSRAKPLSPFHSCAYATIDYGKGERGELVYLKPADPPDMTMDVRGYRNVNDSFPHQSTANQFFTESQFESYRKLGEFEMSALAPKAESLAALFEAVRDALREPAVQAPNAAAPVI